MLDELIERFGSGAVVTASPLMLDSGENYRWELRIDGKPEAGIHARERKLSSGRNDRTLLMVYGDEEVELVSWSTTTLPYGPAASPAWTLRFAAPSRRVRLTNRARYKVPVQSRP
jgi:hypothetical protein